MPFKSKAQRRKFAELLVNGEITEEAYERWNRETGAAELPERANKAKKSKTSRKVNRKSSAKGARKKKAQSKTSSDRG